MKICEETVNYTTKFVSSPSFELNKIELYFYILTYIFRDFKLDVN